MINDSLYSNISQLYPINNYLKSYPLTWNHNLPSYEIDKIYSSGIINNTNCIICDSIATTNINSFHSVFCTFDHLERKYHKNICVKCNIQWYNVNITYCTDCDGYLINQCNNHNICNCVFSDRIKRAQTVKCKKCIIFDDNKNNIYENNNVNDYKHHYNNDEIKIIPYHNVSLETSIKNNKKRTWWNYLFF